MRPCPNAQLVINSRDRLTYQAVADPTIRTVPVESGPITNFTLSTSRQGQNLIQGSIDKIQVAEITFPYDYPNVIPSDLSGNVFSFLGTDIFFIRIIGGSTPGVYPIKLAAGGFYTGSELATAVNARLTAVLGALSPPITGADVPQVSYNSTTNCFTFSNTSTTLAYALTNFNTGSVFPSGIPKTLLYIMGFPTKVSLAVSSSFVGNSAQLVYTQFIDIGSQSLSGQQFIRDGSTIQFPNVFTKDLVARVYVADETSTNPTYVYDASGNPILAVPGTRPFVIHRQFKNAKMIANTLANCLNNVDITLYDDLGNVMPLPSSAPRDFQITFNVYEQQSEEGLRS